MPRSQSRAAKERSDNLIWTRGTASSALAASNSGLLINFTSAMETATGQETRNWTVERLLGNVTITVPASTAGYRSCMVFLAIDVLDTEAVGSSAYPEPFSDHRSFPWVDGRPVYAPENPSASYASPAINGIFEIDMKSKRRAHGLRNELCLFGYHDNGLSANPSITVAYSVLWRMR